MTISSDAELEDAVAKVNALIKGIHDYAGRRFDNRWKIKFPRGYVRTAIEQRARLPFLKDGPFKDNIAYTLILGDTTHWLLVRTDVSGTIKEQLIKLHMFLLGSLVESITKVYLKGRCGKNFKGRTQFLAENSIVSSAAKDDLDWLWDMRNNMHLFLVQDSEYASPDYTTQNYNRAVKAFQNLLKALCLDSGVS
jgi:hypothetical protein